MSRHPLDATASAIFTANPPPGRAYLRRNCHEPFLALRMCRRPAAARAAPAGRPLLHDRSVLRQARIADRICRRSCLHDCTPLYAASGVSDVLSPLTVACFRRAPRLGALRRRRLSKLHSKQLRPFESRTMARQCYASHKRNGRRVSSAASKPSSSALVRATISWVSCSGMPARTETRARAPQRRQYGADSRRMRQARRVLAGVLLTAPPPLEVALKTVAAF